MCRVFQHSVEEIDLSGENMVDGEWLAYLGAFRCLQSLKLTDCRGVSSSSIWPLSGMAVLGLSIKRILLCFYKTAVPLTLPL